MPGFHFLCPMCQEETVVQEYTMNTSTLRINVSANSNNKTNLNNKNFSSRSPDISEAFENHEKELNSQVELQNLQNEIPNENTESNNDR